MNARWQGEPIRRRVFSSAAAAILFVLLVLPTLAGIRLAHHFDWRLIVGYLAIAHLLTLFLYWQDKRRAEANAWRTPESTLHLLELCGGWPAAFVAQRVFRHKISKRSYQAGFWFIVVLHQFVSFDYLQR